MIEVPEPFARETIQREGDAGRTWLETLPELVADVCRDWGLVVERRTPMHGYLGVVVPVTRDGEDLALKITWVDAENVDEAIALRAWGGRGAVRLLDDDPARGALLLERLDAGTTLENRPLDEAVDVAASLIARLAVPAPPGLRSMDDVARGLIADLPRRWSEVDGVLPRATVDEAVRFASSRVGKTGASLVNSDLHYGNVLRGKREPWLVINPKVLAGDPEFAVAPLLWTRFDETGGPGVAPRLMAIVDGAGLDFDLARGWALARVVEYRFWALGLGFTRDPERSLALADALMAL